MYALVDIASEWGMEYFILSRRWETYTQVFGGKSNALLVDPNNLDPSHV
jgi:hypothetical protein